MVPRTRLLFLSLSLLACIALVIPAAASASPQTPVGHSTSAKKAPRPTGSPPAISLATRVETLGTTKFQSAYGGQETSPSDRLAVLYVVRAHAAAFLAAVRNEAAHSAGPGYEVAYVPHSWAQLNALTMKIARQEPRWRGRGIKLAQWGPDAASSKVVITLRSYTAAAGRELLAAYGAGWVSVSHKSMKQRWIAADRYYDSAPFYGGDRIFNDSVSVKCTDAFTMLGNVNTSNHWQTTAGHCGSRTWYTNYTYKYKLGKTSTNYFHNFGGSTNYDIQTIGPVNAWGDVWGNDSTIYLPYTTLHPGDGASICFDGATTTLVCGASVYNSGPFCTTNTDTGEECGLGAASDSNVICNAGDSGGPVFQRTSNDDYIKAVGTIILWRYNSSTSKYECAYLLIGNEESTTNTHLDTNPTG